MKSIVTSVSAIDDVLNSACVYVDKTAYMHKLIMSADKQFFISRPRRFGKSLMLSTFKAIFEGRKELFAECAIADIKDPKTGNKYDWPVYDVVHLDMSDAVGDSVESVKLGLNILAMSAARQLKLKIKRNDDPSKTFLAFWEAVKKNGKQVVVLVDEYDIPLQGFLSKPAELEELRKAMHDFYVRLKSYGDNIRFLMMTGVTKLTKLSVFSGLNNPKDLTMSKDYAGMLGYTEKELKKYFKDHIKAFAKERGISKKEVESGLLKNYDRYRFSPDSKVCVLNPISVGKALDEKRFGAYWSSTGAASLAFEALRKADRWPSDFEDVVIKTINLDVCDPFEMPAVPLLYQTGYLTIKQGNLKEELSENGNLPSDMIRLGIPNEEVRQVLAMGHMASMIGENKGTVFNSNSGLAIYALEKGKLDDAVRLFRSAVAALPYEWLIDSEGGVKIAFLDFFQMMRGAHVTSERETANGRIDAVIETENTVYVFEFKYNHSAQEAVDQIIEKRYHEPYLGKGKPVYGIGLNFNPEKGSSGIEEAVVELIKN